MARVKFQVYMDEKYAVPIAGMCKVYGWSATQVFERLYQYYLKTQALAEDYELFKDSSGEVRECAVRDERDELQIVSCDLALIMGIKEGLVPPKPFDQFEEEMEAQHG